MLRHATALCLALAASILLAGCAQQTASGLRVRINPPGLAVEGLEVLSGRSSASVRLRLHNFSTVPMRFSRVEVQLSVSGITPPLTLHTSPDLEIPGLSSEPVALRTELPATWARSLAQASERGTGLAYQLTGTVETTQPSHRFSVEHEGALSPVPGIPNAFR